VCVSSLTKRKPLVIPPVANIWTLLCVCVCVISFFCVNLYISISPFCKIEIPLHTQKANFRSRDIKNMNHILFYYHDPRIYNTITSDYVLGSILTLASL